MLSEDVVVSADRYDQIFFIVYINSLHCSAMQFIALLCLLCSAPLDVDAKRGWRR